MTEQTAKQLILTIEKLIKLLEMQQTRNEVHIYHHHLTLQPSFVPSYTSTTAMPSLGKRLGATSTSVD